MWVEPRLIVRLDPLREREAAVEFIAAEACRGDD